MPRSGPGTYLLPPNVPDQQPNTTIQSAWANSFSADVQTTFNTAWPVSLGGTGTTDLKFDASQFGLKDGTDPTKQVIFNLSGLPTATTRTLSAPYYSGTLALTNVPNGYQNVTSTQANIDITGLGDFLELEISGVFIPTTGDAFLKIQIGSGSIDTGNNYAYQFSLGQGATTSANGAGAQNGLFITAGSGQSDGTTFKATIGNFNRAIFSGAVTEAGSVLADSSRARISYYSRHLSAVACDRIRFIASSGSIAAGSYFIVKGFRP